MTISNSAAFTQSAFRLLALLLGVSASLALAQTPPKLNDTGQGACYDGSAAAACNIVARDGQGHPRQDGRFGRDAKAAAGLLTKNGGGAAGFDYTKICNSGEAAGVGACPVNPTLGAGANDWACTRDNVTNLVWEIKTVGTASAELRHKDHLYTWYSTVTTTNGGVVGSTGSNTCSATLPSSLCNTQAYVVAVNTATLCGASDWRLPATSELQSLVHYGLTTQPSNDATFFPNTIASVYWAGSSYAANPSSAWVVNFGDGFIGASNKADLYSARLVRGG